MDRSLVVSDMQGMTTTTTTKKARRKRKLSVEKNQPLKVVYISNPMRVHTSASEFRALVQELTGQDAEFPDDPNKFGPALVDAREMDLEKKQEGDDDDDDDEVLLDHHVAAMEDLSDDFLRDMMENLIGSHL